MQPTSEIAAFERGVGPVIEIVSPAEAEQIIAHIVPKVHGGDDDLQNLALACVDCNLHTVRVLNMNSEDQLALRSS